MESGNIRVMAKLPYGAKPTERNKHKLIQAIIAEMWPKDAENPDLSRFKSYHKTDMWKPVFGFNNPAMPTGMKATEYIFAPKCVFHGAEPTLFPALCQPPASAYHPPWRATALSLTHMTTFASKKK